MVTPTNDNYALDVNEEGEFVLNANVGLETYVVEIDAEGNAYVSGTDQLIFRSNASVDGEASSGSGQGEGGEASNPAITAANGVLTVTGLAVDASKEGVQVGTAAFKGVHALSRGVNGAVALIAIGQFAAKAADHNLQPSDGARLAGAALILGSNAIPVAGSFISFGLGMADATGAFDPFYKSFDTPGVPTIYLNTMLSLPK